MLLDNIGVNNDFTPELRKKLEDEVRKMGGSNGVIRYKFDIANPDPDPDKKGQVVFPWLYTLTPKTFFVLDPFEKRPNKQASKKVVLIENTEVVNDNINVTRVKSVKVKQNEKGVFTLRINDSIEDLEMAMYLQLHPANGKGEFKAQNRRSVFEVIDDKAEAQGRTKSRSNRVKALLAVEKMSVAELREFALAMAWEESDVDIIRDQAQTIAESSPDVLLNLLDENNKTVEYKATIQKAVDKNIIYFDNANYSYMYTDTRQVLLAIDLSGDGSTADKLAFWFINGGDKADAAYKKLKASLK